jgi:hypothetical protein
MFLFTNCTSYYSVEWAFISRVFFFHLGKKIAISLSISYFSFFIYNVSMYMANESNLFLVIFAELGDYVTILFSFLPIFHVDME